MIVYIILIRQLNVHDDCMLISYLKLQLFQLQVHSSDFLLQNIMLLPELTVLACKLLLGFPSERIELSSVVTVTGMTQPFLVFH